MQFGIKFTAKPGTQFRIKRESLDRLRKALAEKGIEFACRAVKIDLGDLSKLGLANPSPSEPAVQEPKQDLPSSTDDQGGAVAQDGSSPSTTVPTPAAQTSDQKARQRLSPDQLMLIEAAAAAAVALLDEDDQLQAGKKRKKARK